MIQHALLLLTSDEDPPFMNREELEKRMDELARQFAKSHDEEVKAELEALSKRVAEMKRRLV
jgi:uncharacterized protein involved in exopolysaccharide biosynthesis